MPRKNWSVGQKTDVYRHGNYFYSRSWRLWYWYLNISCRASSKMDKKTHQLDTKIETFGNDNEEKIKKVGKDENFSLNSLSC